VRRLSAAPVTSAAEAGPTPAAAKIATETAQSPQRTAFFPLVADIQPSLRIDQQRAQVYRDRPTLGEAAHEALSSRSEQSSLESQRSAPNV
jgi:hypothetical protein